MKTLIRTLSGLTLASFGLLAALPAAAQLPASNDSGISTGHVHFTVPNPAKYREILRLLGGEPDSSGPLQVVRFPGIYILLTEGEAAADSIETAANHVGFQVNDFPLYRAKLEAVGASFFFENAETGQILADMPDGLRIELLTDPEQEEPIVFHHMHLAATELEDLQAWYIEVFGAEAGERRGLPSALVPGGRVDIMPASGGAPKGSKGGVIDHIGFEVDDMDAFASHLASLGISFDSEPRHIDAINLTIAFLTDPEGTYIEVTEGLRELD